MNYVVPDFLVANRDGELNVVAGAGSIWIASDNDGGAVSRVDPATRAVSDGRETETVERVEAADAAETADAVLETLDAELQDPAVDVVDELPAWPTGATRFTRPIRHASRASTGSPV